MEQDKLDKLKMILFELRLKEVNKRKRKETFSLSNFPGHTTLPVDIRIA